MDWRWISLWAALRGSVTLSTSGSAELASWEENGLITKHPGQEESAVGYIKRAVSGRGMGDDREVRNLGS